MVENFQVKRIINLAKLFLYINSHREQDSHTSEELILHWYSESPHKNGIVQLELHKSY